MNWRTYPILGLFCSLSLNSVTWAEKPDFPQKNMCTISLSSNGQINFGLFSLKQSDQLKKNLSVVITCSKYTSLHFKLQDNKPLNKGDDVYTEQCFALTAEPAMKGTSVGYYTIAPWAWKKEEKEFIQMINSEKQVVLSPNPDSLLRGALLKSGERYSFRDAKNKRFTTKRLTGEFEIHLAKLMMTEGKIYGSFSLELIHG